MSKNTLQLEIGGKTVKIRFNMGAMEHLGQIIGQDPISATKAPGNVFTSEFENLKNMVYAGMLGECDHNDATPDFTENDVISIVRKMDKEQAAEVTAVFERSYAGKKSDTASKEGSQDTQ